MAEYLVSDPAIQDAHPHTQYDLIANICHEGEPGKGYVNCLHIQGAYPPRTKTATRAAKKQLVQIDKTKTSARASHFSVPFFALTARLRRETA